MYQKYYTQEDENISLTSLGKHPPSDSNKTEFRPLTVVYSYSVIVEIIVDITFINKLLFFISIHLVLTFCLITTSFSSQEDSNSMIGPSELSLAGLASSKSSMTVVSSGSSL